MEKDCYVTATGSVTVDCNGGANVEVTDAPVMATTNNVYFWIGSPMAMLDVTVTLTDGADYTESFVTSEMWGGEFLADVPYGSYTYTMEKEGYVTATGSVTVDCNNGANIEVTDAPEVPTSIGNTEASVVLIYPNPAVDVINVSSSSAIVNVEVYNINGAKQKQVTGEDIKQINISELAKGLYIIKTTDVNGKTLLTKVNKF